MRELRRYLLENLEELKGVVAEINGYNGSLDYLEVWENEDYIINELFSNPYEAIRSSYFGCYNFNDSLIRFNGYGNIESLSESEYMDELTENIEDIIDELMKIYNNLNITEELKELIENVEV